MFFSTLTPCLWSSFMPDFLNLTAPDLLGQIILCYAELSCALEDVTCIPDLYLSPR